MKEVGRTSFPESHKQINNSLHGRVLSYVAGFVDVVGFISLFGLHGSRHGQLHHDRGGTDRKLRGVGDLRCPDQVRHDDVVC
ncbi:hypothetical protein RM96_16505 [Cupriavidus sp. IDO]|nr:hypothetical protein RM96_16505 [Cupriavidus sp. IDO]